MREQDYSYTTPLLDRVAWVVIVGSVLYLVAQLIRAAL